MISNIIFQFLIQTMLIFGAIVLYGFLIAFCNKVFYRNMGRFGRSACYVTGCIGTPLHEAAHALMCVIFGHKVHEIKFFQIDSSDGCLGYVKHSYNENSKFQKAGNFFIGIAPIIVIAGVLYLMSIFLVPGLIDEVSVSVSQISVSGGIGDSLSIMMNMMWTIFGYVFTAKGAIFLVLSMFFALHMTLSKPDIAGAKSGAFLCLLVLLIINIIMGVVGGSVYSKFVSVMAEISAYLNTMLILSLIISLVAVALSFLFRMIFGRGR